MFLVWSLFSPGDFPWYLFTTTFVDQAWVKGTVQMQYIPMGWLQFGFSMHSTVRTKGKVSLALLGLFPFW